MFVSTVNNNFNPGIGYLKPATCNQDLALGDQLISDRLKELGKKSSHMLTIEEQRKLKEDTEKDPNFKHFLPGKPVLLNIPRHGPKEFEKETSAKRGQIFLIHSLDFRQVPVMFKLKAIDGSRIRGNCLNVILVMLLMLLFLCFLYLFHSCSLGFFKVN